MTYEEIKIWCKDKDNQKKMVLGVCFVLVFIVGFGAGRFDKPIQAATYKTQTNYTTNQDKKPSPFVSKEGDMTAAATTGKVAGAATSTPSSSCVIKGNISSKGKKIYHVAGGAFYKIVKPEQCFNTEAEALAAGFIKSSR